MLGDREDGFSQKPFCEKWWSQAGSNRRPPHCERGALPAELWPLKDAKRREKARLRGAPVWGVIYGGGVGAVNNRRQNPPRRPWRNHQALFLRPPSRYSDPHRG